MVLTVLYPGLGQIYNGQFLKGIGTIGVYATIIMVITMPFDLKMVLGILVIIAAMVDAYRICQKRASGYPVTQSDWF
jgi:TM2 domain-containing membrane protein YozV